MHTVLSHVIDPSKLIVEAYRVQGMEIKICDAIFKATLSSSLEDPLALALRILLEAMLLTIY